MDVGFGHIGVREVRFDQIEVCYPVVNVTAPSNRKYNFIVFVRNASKSSDFVRAFGEGSVKRDQGRTFLPSKSFVTLNSPKQ